MPTNGQDVKIAHYTRSKFNSLTSKDNATIYYVEETDGKIKQYIGNSHVVSDITKAEIEAKLTGNIPSHTHNQYLLTTGKAADSDKLNGLELNSTTTNNQPNKVMRTDGSGYANFGWIKTSSGNTNSPVTDVYVNIGDGWIYKKSLDSFKEELVIPSKTSDLKNDTGFITGYTETDPIFTAWNKSTGISITKSQVSDLIEATQALSGLMSATDKARLDVLHSLLEENTANNVVDSINEVLAIFNNYPEGADLVTALSGKVDKVSGKGLSTNDFTTTEKNKLSGIATNATANTGTVTKVSVSTEQIPGMSTLITNTTTTPTIVPSISNAALFRNTIGAGTSNLEIGTTSTTAKAGDWTPTGTWKEVYSGTSARLATGNYIDLTLNETASYYNKPMMMEIKYGNTGNTFTNQIVTFNVGTSSATNSSKTQTRTVSITEFDGRYFKTIAVKAYVTMQGTTDILRVGYFKTLIGDFGTTGTLTWTTQASDSLSVYIGKVWVLE